MAYLHTILVAFLAFTPLLKEDLSIEGRSKAEIYEAAYAYFAQMPQYNRFSPAPPKGNAEAGTIEAERSFVVYEQKGILNHAIAEIAFAITAQASDGHLSYQFSNLKVYPYKRNRYGVYEKGSSKALSEQALSQGEWKKKSALWMSKLQGYAAQLKLAMPAGIDPIVQH